MSLAYEGIAMIDRLNPVDASFFYLEDATTPMHMGGVAIFKETAAGFDYESADVEFRPQYEQGVDSQEAAEKLFKLIDAIEDRMLLVEDSVMDTPLDAVAIRQLYARRHEVIRFQRLAGLMKDVAGRLAGEDDLPCIDPAVRPFFRDVWDHLQRAEFRLTGLRDIAASVIETNGMLEQQRQGVITRQLAAWAAILAVPTAIAGIYGMNFDFMPELEWRLGYPFALTLIFGGSALVFWRFKSIGWL